MLVLNLASILSSGFSLGDFGHSLSELMTAFVGSLKHVKFFFRH